MKSLVFALFCVVVFSGSAQTYSISPAKTVSFTAAQSNITINDIYQVNTGNSRILLKWELVSINVPVQWQYSMCDYQTCYSGIPAGPNTMDSVNIGGQGFLGLNIDPGTTAGAGIVKVFVYQNGFKSSGDTLTWYISAGAVGMNEITINGPVTIYPNPTAGKLHINMGYINPLSAIISDLLGREVMSLSLTSAANIIDISALPKGAYTLNIITPGLALFKRIIKE